MEKQTRRKFLMQSSLGAAVLTTASGLAVAACSPTPTSAASSTDNTTNTSVNIPLTAEELNGPLVVYVRDLQSGEFGVLAGQREIVYRDPDLIRRLLGIAH